jgi:hypothetical protein
MGATRHLAKNGDPRCDRPLWNAGVRNLLSLTSLVTMRKSTNTNCRYGAVSRQASVYSGQSHACLEWDNVCERRMVHFPARPAPIRRHMPVHWGSGGRREAHGRRAGRRRRETVTNFLGVGSPGYRSFSTMCGEARYASDTSGHGWRLSGSRAAGVVPPRTGPERDAVVRLGRGRRG